MASFKASCREEVERMPRDARGLRRPGLLGGVLRRRAAARVRLARQHG